MASPPSSFWFMMMASISMQMMIASLCISHPNLLSTLIFIYYSLQLEPFVLKLSFHFLFLSKSHGWDGFFFFFLPIARASTNFWKNEIWYHSSVKRVDEYMDRTFCTHRDIPPSVKMAPLMLWSLNSLSTLSCIRHWPKWPPPAHADDTILRKPQQQPWPWRCKATHVRLILRAVKLDEGRAGGGCHRR